MNILIMMKGLPGSGKSFAAKKMVNENHGLYKRVNRDDIRMMIDNGKWSRSNEKLVKIIRDSIIKQSLSEGFNVIVDDTNLDPSLEVHYKEIAKAHKADFQIIDYTAVDKNLCIARDLERPNSVGSKVINRMYNQYLAHKETPQVIEGAQNAIMCDLDGTLALFPGKDPYERDFTKDIVNEPVRKILDMFARLDEYETYKFIMCSGRKDKFRDQTKQWLDENEIPCDLLYMREGEDDRKDSIVKKEIYDNNIRGKYNVLFVLDDRDQVVQLWRNLGLTCLQVAEGDF